MMTEAAIRMWREAQAQSLEDWREPDGFLLPTEPDPEERERVRIRLRAQLLTLNRVLGEPDVAALTAELRRREGGEAAHPDDAITDTTTCGGCGRASYAWSWEREGKSPPLADCVWVRDAYDGQLLFHCALEYGDGAASPGESPRGEAT